MTKNALAGVAVAPALVAPVVARAFRAVENGAADRLDRVKPTGTQITVDGAVAVSFVTARTCYQWVRCKVDEARKAIQIAG